MANTLVESVYQQKCEEERTRSAITWPSARYATDPIGFCSDILGFMPTRDQSRMLTTT